MKLTKEDLQQLIREEVMSIVEVSAKDLFKQSGGKERFFYDLLSDLENDMGTNNYYKWLSSELKKIGFNTKVDRTGQPEAEETLYRYYK